MPVAARLGVIHPADLEADWNMIARKIGERRAGSEAEHKAARYILEQFRAAGLEAGHLEAFECKSLRAASAHLEARDGDGWERVPCEVLAGSPSTQPHDRPLERELIWVEMPEQARLLKPGSMKGKALGLFGPLATDTPNYRAMVQTGADLVIWVDDRLPFEWAKADGMIPSWVRRHGALPTLAVSFRTGYAWRTDGLSRIRACLHTDVVDETSYNVVAELKGTDPTLGLIAFGAHYDTQVGNPGADDDGSGTVSVMALARAFAKAARKKPFKRTLRFMTFGTEEQLSVGSRAYVLAHRAEMKAHALMLNFDSLSSSLGHTEVLVAGLPQLRKWSQAQLQARGLLARYTEEITPFSDHFPFTVFGVPALYFGRSNCPGGRWQHHSVHDTLETVSPEQVVKILNAAAPLAAAVADSKSLPFKAGIRPQDRGEIRRLAREMYEI